MDAMFFIVLGATLASFLLTLLFGRFVIPMLCALHAGQSIREVGPQWHNTKAGTPTWAASCSSLQSFCVRLASAGRA